MPSQLHEVLLTLFRNRPTLAPELLRGALDQRLPRFAEARIDSENLTDVQPAEYRADLVVCLASKAPALGIILEVQLRPDPSKRFAWPAYVHNLRARLHYPVCLLVITASEAVARWAVEPIHTGVGDRPWSARTAPQGRPHRHGGAAGHSRPRRGPIAAVF